MFDSLKGKTALVTGAGKRIGRETALALGNEGANIVIHYHYSQTDADSLYQELLAKGVKAWTIRADLEKPEDYSTLIQRAINLAGSLEILVNNASIFPTEKLEDLSFESLTSNIHVNAWTPFVLSRDFKRLVGKGKIINLLDSRVWGYDWTHVGYILSKHVLTALTKMTALDYAPDIAVNGIAPGLILPPPGKDESYIDRLTGTVPLQKHGDPTDVAEAIVFLARSSFVTGEVIFVDGGRHLREKSVEH